MTEYVIETKGLTKYFGSKLALNHFELNIPVGGIHAFIGANGAGKSTLFRILLGLESPSTGECKILGVNSEQITPELRGKIGYVNEEHTLPNWMTAAEVTNMQRNLYPQWRQDIYESVVGNFDVQPLQKVSQLSRGERAGLNLAMALAQAPEVLILDEPTLGLDVVAKQAFLEALMYTETDINTTIIYCSHQMEEIERVAENLIIVEDGSVKYIASPDDFCQRINYWICDIEEDSKFLSSLSCVLSVKLIEGQYHIITADQNSDHFKEYLLTHGATNPMLAPISLEKAISSVLAKNHRTPSKVA